jgi:hypothetical protein
MTQTRPRDLLTDSLLARLGGTSPYASAFAGQVLAGSAPALPGAGSATSAMSGTSGTGPDVTAVMRRDIAKLDDVGYLKVALPPEFGGLGCTLRQAACGQRRLARHAPLTALAVSAHLYWTGAAADAYPPGTTRSAGSCSRPPAARSSPPATARPRRAATCGSPTRSRVASPPGRAGTGSAAPPCCPR